MGWNQVCWKDNTKHALMNKGGYAKDRKAETSLKDEPTKFPR